jgi:hypothetical protein
MVIRSRPTPAAALRDVEAATLALDGSPPVTANHPSDVPCPLPPADRVGARVDCFPTRAAFPDMAVGSARTSSFSRCYGAAARKLHPSSLM